QPAQLLGRVEGPGELDGERGGVGVDDAAHVTGEHLPQVARLVVDRPLRDVDVAAQPVAAQLLQKCLLAGVAAVQGADADAGALGYGGDGGGRVVREDGAG